jgi:hypothetical protein
LADPNQRYSLACPNCSGDISVQIDRIPPVQARFRCPHCKEPMDFPSREEARARMRVPAEGGDGVSASAPPAPAPPATEPAPAAPPAAPEHARPRATNPPTAPSGNGAPGEVAQFRVEKRGFQSDIFDRRAIRNLIRTGEIVETDRIRVGDAQPVIASDLPYLKSLFSLARAQKTRPPVCCRTNTERIAFFRCHDDGRPLCEECAPEKKFGGTTIRVCQQCGGSARDIHTA